MQVHSKRSVAALASALLLMTGVSLIVTSFDADAQQQRRGRQVPVKPLPAPPQPAAAVRPDEPLVKAPEPEVLESVQADVSTRTVAVTSNFTGTEIVVFGAIDNSRQPSPESGVYDIVIVVEGVPSKVTVRKKDRVGGIWLNTEAAEFDRVPSYYAIASTRPLDELAAEATLIGYEIGFDYVRMDPVDRGQGRLPPATLAEFRRAVVRLKERDGLYTSEPHGVTFIGRSLFRSTISLPATVNVGPFDTRVYLFKQERLISQYNVRLNLEREGLERFLHDFAFKHSFWYGIVTVLIALGSGLAASSIFNKSAH
jgi:uncharacterized protein (TIGR02186 family)